MSHEMIKQGFSECRIFYWFGFYYVVFIHLPG